MKYSEILKLAFANIKVNKLRSIITMSIIALGVMALVGILTSIDGIIYSMSSSFNPLGANSFSIDRSSDGFQGHRRGQRAKESPPFYFDQVIEFKKLYSDRAIVSIGFRASNNSTLKYENEKTSPTIRIRGIDENYFKVFGVELQLGRTFSLHEVENGNNVVVIGPGIVKNLFSENEIAALNKFIIIDGQKYLVIGILASRGSSLNERADQSVFIPLQKAKIEYAHKESSFEIDVAVNDAAEIDRMVDEATGTFRTIRGLRAYEESNFRISKSDGIIEFLKENTVKLRASTIAIALMTLLGAAIGLMNIMLVSVTERTREIGIAKAMGATRKNILDQFLLEAILICMIGGILGIIIAIPLGNIVTFILGGEFIIPWAWIILGLVVCTLVGISSGIYPAIRASKLDPVEALRYE
ncbi:MAG: ABC transporter permease [Bacteroidota bacterium]|nr:ABC transporter permease [Bacteroidota bacterium]